MKSEVIKLYKTLYYLGKDYPKGSEWFHSKLKAAFMKNCHETNSKRIKELIEHGEYIVKELEALYRLRKYRAMKQRYYD